MQELREYISSYAVTTAVDGHYTTFVDQEVRSESEAKAQSADNQRSSRQSRAISSLRDHLSGLISGFEKAVGRVRSCSLHLNHCKGRLRGKTHRGFSNSINCASELSMPFSKPADETSNKPNILFSQDYAASHESHIQQIQWLAAHQYDLPANNTLVKGYVAELDGDIPCAESASLTQHGAFEDPISFTDWTLQQTLHSRSSHSLIRNPSISRAHLVSPGSVSGWKSPENAPQSPDSVFQSPNLNSPDSEPYKTGAWFWERPSQTHNTGGPVADYSQMTNSTQYSTTSSQSSAPYIQHRNDELLSVLRQDQAFEPSHVISSPTPPCALQPETDLMRPGLTAIKIYTNLLTTSPRVVEGPGLLWSASTASSRTLNNSPSSASQEEFSGCQPFDLDLDSPLTYYDSPVVDMSRRTSCEEDGLGLYGSLSVQDSYHGLIKQDQNKSVQLENATKLATIVEESNRCQEQLSVLYP